MTEAFYSCSIAYLGDALPFNTWSADFVISPSLHESEAKYTLYAGEYHNPSRVDSNSTSSLSTEQIAYAINHVKEAVTKLREMSPLWEMHKEGVDLSTIEWAEH